MEIFDKFLLDLIKEVPKFDIAKLTTIIRVVKLKKNEVLINEGSSYSKFFYVKKGLLRGYNIDENGEDKTIFFIWDKEFGSDPACFLNNKPAKLNWAAVEDCEIIEFNKKGFDEIAQKNIYFLRLKMFFIEKIFLRILDRIENFIVLNPEARFIKMLEERPALCERIPDKYLASHLGITPVSLCRIRKRALN